MAKLILYTGKGGTGKSTVSAATALHWAQQGYKTLLVSSDPAHSTEDVVGVPVGSAPTPISENFWAMNINAEAKANVFKENFQEQIDGTFSKWFPGFDSEILSDWASFPGMDEVFALEELMHLVRGVEYDLIVFDTAPTGHTLKALTAPDSLNRFLLRMLRMKARMEGIKSIFIKKGDTDKLVKLLEDTTNKIEMFKELLRDEYYVNINLVGIPTEAGYQECKRTVSYLNKQGFTVKNIILNHLIPNFDEETWQMATQNKAVALLKMEMESQLPYLKAYNELCHNENISLVGVSKLPFQPMGNKLGEFAKFIWGAKSIEFEPHKSASMEGGDGRVYLRLKFPQNGTVKLHKNTYSIDGFEYYIPHLDTVDGKKISRKKSRSGATYSYEV
tara:strand:+ start:774 stop:1940 length:1167 start_codon:yes stop_codon:yes gene_type:complete